MFGDKTLFLTPENNTQQVIISRNSLTGRPVSSTIKLSQENIFKKTPPLIRQSMTELIENSSEMSWPPTFEELTHELMSQEMLPNYAEILRLFAYR